MLYGTMRDAMAQRLQSRRPRSGKEAQSQILVRRTPITDQTPRHVRRYTPGTQSQWLRNIVPIRGLQCVLQRRVRDSCVLVMVVVVGVVGVIVSLVILILIVPDIAIHHEFGVSRL